MNLKWIANCHVDDLHFYFNTEHQKMFLKRDPQKTNKHSVDELKKMGYYGIYEEDKDDGKHDSP
jgi:hypothetical protein